jgi:hypothetical protein
MKERSLCPDPLGLYHLGLRNLLDLCVLIHIGRTGIHGTTRKRILEALRASERPLRIAYETIVSSTNRLQDLGLITTNGRLHKQGTDLNYILTKHGWEILTTSPVLTLYPQQAAAV